MNHNKALRILFIYNGIFVFAVSFLGPLYAIYVGLIDSDILSVSATWSVYLISAAVFSLIVSKKGDKIKEKEHLLMMGFILRAIPWLLFIFATNIYHIVLIQILLGLGDAFWTPSFNAILAEHLDAGRFIEEFADWKLVLNIATGIGTIAGGIIVKEFGFDWLFISMSILATISFIGIWVQPRELL